MIKEGQSWKAKQDCRFVADLFLGDERPLLRPEDEIAHTEKDIVEVLSLEVGEVYGMTCIVTTESGKKYCILIENVIEYFVLCG